jgi:hypothetical protein
MSDESVVEVVEEEVTTDYDSMSADELDNLMREEADAALYGPPPQAEVEVEAEAPVEQAAVSEESAPTESEPEQEFDDRDLQIQELTLQMQSLSEQKELASIAASKHAGAVGYLQKQMNELTAERNRSTSAGDPYDREDEITAEPHRGQPLPGRTSRALEDKVAELQAEQMNGTTKRIYGDFLNQIANDLTAQGVEQDGLGAEQESIISQITPTLKQRFEPFGDISQMQPKTVEKVVNMVLQSAYTDVKLAKVAEFRKTNLARKASQISESRIVKQAASPSGSGGKSVQDPPQKRVEDMTAEEADAALIALYGDGGYRPRR